MARKRRRRKKRYYRDNEYEDLPSFELSARTKRTVMIVVFLVLSVLTFLSLFDQAGALGNIVGQVLGLLFGWAALVSPVIFFAVALALFISGRRENREERDEEETASSNLRIYLGAAIFTFALTGLLHLIAMRDNPVSAFELVKSSEGGGYLGVLFALPLVSLVDFWASIIILSGLLLISLIMLFNLSFTRIIRRSGQQGARIFTQKESPTPGIKINKMENADFSVAKVLERPSIGMGPELPLPPTLKHEDEASSLAENGDKTAALDTLAEKYRKGTWQLPSITLLEESHDTVDSGNIETNVTIVQKTLKDFGIEVEMGEVNVGPTVTQYTLRPATGIKLSQIIALQNDLALALAAPSIRIEAPIPGRSLVGIEIPNKATATVRIKDIIQTEGFISHKSNLAIALGRDVAGHAMVADLARMPHLLIAGATGTGKSVAINSLLISLLYRNSPEELRLIVIDPKRVELNLYNGMPHLLTPVVTEHEKAVNALKWAVKEMDRRYNLMAESGKRNIIEYNSKAPQKLPYVVIIVDELADLMAVAQADVEAAVVRLAQMARAVGVHLVLATQRPSVDIITGLIKANITARMAFAVASQIDSRTILDTAGAEKLLGAGDMLYITAELGKPKRVQGTYLSEREVKNVVDFVRNQAGEVEYVAEILEKQRSPSSIPGFEDDIETDDDLLNDAIEIVKRAGKASASLLQRRLRVGYARAARLLDLMEEKGVVGPGDGAKPRDVYLSGGDEYEERSNEDQV